MMRGLFFVLMLVGSYTAFSQQYRLVYDSRTIPELYDHTEVFAEVKDGAEYKRIPPNKYKLTTTEGKLDGNDLSYSRNTLYRNNGLIHFILHVNNAKIPLALALPVLEDIRINSYTDSIKPILNYYLNVEGKFSSGKVYPMDTGFVSVTSDAGRMNGLEWVLPKERNFEKVHFTVTNRFRPAEQKSVTLYLKKYKDPKDDLDYQERTEEEIIRGRRGR